MKYAASQVKAIQAEKPGAQNPHVQAVAQGHGDGGGDLASLAFRLGLGDRGQKKHRHGIGNGGGEHNKGQSHPREHPIDGKCIADA